MYAFSVQLERLRQLVNLRNRQGCKLTRALILSKFNWVGKLGGINVGKGKDVTDKDLPSNVLQTNYNKTYVLRTVAKNEIEALKDNPRRLGKAKVAPRSYKVKKVMRNKDTLVAVH